jgi:hypothetical protein
MAKIERPGPWINWSGGECPVAANAMVDVRFRDGGRQDRTPAGYWADTSIVFDCWKHVDSNSDITAYRISKAPQTTERTRA